MKNKTRFLIVFASAIMLALNVSARENIGYHGHAHRSATPPHNSLLALCSKPTAQTDLDINNVRATILDGGDMWWDLNSAKYEVPKGSKDYSIFAGALWIGGVDQSGNLKVAAQTYRQDASGTVDVAFDFWPGPLDTVNASTTAAVCAQFDKHFKITRQEVEDFVNNQGSGVIPQSILDWPGNGDVANGYSASLAPYYDANGDGHYNPYDGDYPDYDITGNRGCAAQLYGDQTLWWVINDKGNIHTSSHGDPIGLEIQCQAFAYATNDAINNMTFYKYKIINRSSFTVDSTYFGQWVDPDLGYYNDDYVGCDVKRGFGYCYNGLAVDGNGGPGTYGANPPAVGVDFFQGPLADPGDGIDNNFNGVIDEPGEQILMSKFVYYNNDFSVMGNPVNAIDYYNYLRGKWIDNTPMTYGGNGHQTGAPCNYMFPGTTDPAHPTDWTEATAGNPPGDRRFLESAGRFTLKPGAVNYITTGVVWDRATQGGNLASIPLIQADDDQAQALFNNCFKILNGPDAPDLTIQELNQELTFTLTNKSTSNNYLERYQEKDPYITTDTLDTMYTFEGYQVYQLANATVSVTDLQNPDKARLIFQCDENNAYGQVVNYYLDPTISAWVPVEEVNGANKGITHSFDITTDQFATGNSTLINHKQYYFMAVAYGLNPSEINADPSSPSHNGNNVPYIAGRRNVQVYTAIPHIPEPQAGGTVQNASYGTGVKLTRIEGHGNGGNDLSLSSSTVSQILSASDSRVINPTYDAGQGPVNIKVVDPLNVPNGNFVLKILGDTSWVLTETDNSGNSVSVNSDTTISVNNEQIITQWGLAVTIHQVSQPGNSTLNNNGALDATMTFADPSKAWLTGVQDMDGNTPQNWIRSGTYAEAGPPYPTGGTFNDYPGIDDGQFYQKLLGGTWAPYRLCAHYVSDMDLATPQWNQFISLNNINNIASVEIFITSDKSKWSRCPVLETQDDASLAEGGARKLDLRHAASISKTYATGDPNAGASTNPNDYNYIAATGMGWFPGYAINMETGERLNMAYGEDSWLANDGGHDMKWDPDSKMFADVTPPGSPFGMPIFGGKQFVYVFGHNGDGANDIPRYDAGAKIRSLLDYTSGPPSATNKRNVFKDAMWVGIPLLAQGHQLLESDVTIKLRVAKPYTTGYTTSGDVATSPQNANYPMYSFNTADIYAATNNADAAKNALDLINVVPNPYYAYSAYETNQVDNEVKITNLPQKCTITIYTLNGTLIRRYTKDEPSTSLNWDLKNQSGITIASGLYLIHVDVPDVGERTLKWFGVIRPIDLDTF